MLEYIDQGIEDIRLHLVSGDYTVEQFTVLRSRNFIWKNARVDFAILGESHLMSIKTEDTLFTEICACSPVLFPKADEVFLSEQLTLINTEPQIFTLPSLSYTFTYNCTDYTAGKKQLKTLRDQHKKAEHQLSYTFPKHGFFADKAVTEIYLSELDGKLCTQTVHTYPNKKQMVFTKSLVTLL